MSGRKQHHVWQLLQRGFGLERKPGRFVVFVYQTNRDPFAVHTDRYGAERDFFDVSPGVGADERITEIENGLQAVVKTLQSGVVPSDQSANSIPALISLLEIRTLFLRNEVTGALNEMVNALEKWASDPRIWRELLSSYADRNSDEIRKHITRSGMEAEDLPFARELLLHHIKTNSDDLYRVSKDSEWMVQQIRSRVEAYVKRGHISALADLEDFPKRAERYKQLQYRIESGFGGQLILPDTMVMFIAGKRIKPFLDKSDRLEAVFVPLTSERILIGERSAGASRTSGETLRALASTAHRSFLARSDEISLRTLTNRIGRNATLLSKGGIKLIRRDVLANLRRR